MQNTLKNEIFNVISGKSEVRYGTIIQTIASYLSNGSPASSEIESTKHYKKQEEKRMNYPAASRRGIKTVAIV